MKWLTGFLLGVAALAAVAATQSPRDLVVDTSEQMLAALKADKAVLKKDPQHVYDLVSKIVLPHFDFSVMSKWVLGKNWRKLNDGQKQRFTDEFRTLLVRTYAVSLAEYKNEKLHYLPLQLPDGAQDATVRTEVLRSGGPPIPINYSMRVINGEWKVYDVVIDGVSLVANYRTSFAAEIRQGGVDKLIDKLAARNRRTGS